MFVLLLLLYMPRLIIQINGTCGVHWVLHPPPKWIITICIANELAID